MSKNLFQGIEQDRVEKYFCLYDLSPEQKAQRIIDRMKVSYALSSGGLVYDGSKEWMYIFTENCRLNDAQKDFIIYCTFAEFSSAQAFSNSFSNQERDFVIDALGRWGIIDGLKMYQDDEKVGEIWFDAHEIPIQHIYNLIYSPRFDAIVKKYPELKFLPNRYKSKKCSNAINKTGRISNSECAGLVQEATRLVQNGVYDIDRYELIKRVGPEKIQCFYANSSLLPDIERLASAVRDQIDNIKNKDDLIKYLDLRQELGWMYEQMSVWNMCCYTTQNHLRQLLGVNSKDANIANFDLKNVKDIAHCREILPLVLKYPYLFMDWYRHDIHGYMVDSAPIFVPEYRNGLEKKRKEMHMRLISKDGAFNHFLAKTIVPKELNAFNTRLEHLIARKIYNKIHPGRC